MSHFTGEQKEFLENLFLKIETTINEKTTEIRQEFNEKVAEIKSEVVGELNVLKKELEDKEEENKKLKQNIVDLERKVRKNNIAIFGIPDDETNTINSVLEIFRKIDVDIKAEEINDAYRVTSKNTKNKVPVIVELLSYQKKLAVFKNAKLLKGSNIYITKDLSIEDRKINKILRKHLKLARKEGNSAYIKGNKLVVSNETYTAEELEAETEIVAEKPEKPQSNSAPSTPTTGKRQIEIVNTKEETENKNAKADATRRDKHIVTRSNSATKKK